MALGTLAGEQGIDACELDIDAVVLGLRAGELYSEGEIDAGDCKMGTLLWVDASVLDRLGASIVASSPLSGGLSQAIGLILSSQV